MKLLSELKERHFKRRRGISRAAILFRNLAATREIPRLRSQ